MVDHQFSHPTVDADVLACDEPCLVGAEKQHRICNIKRVADSASRLLISVGTFIDFIARIYPPGGDRIDTDTPCKADCQSVRQRRDSALCCGVALGLRLAHPVPGGRDVDYTSAF